MMASFSVFRRLFRILMEFERIQFHDSMKAHSAPAEPKQLYPLATSHSPALFGDNHLGLMTVEPEPERPVTEVDLSPHPRA